MDAQELRNLQEAYLEVVENQQLDEGYKRYSNRKVHDKMDKLKSKGDLESIGRAGQIRDKLIKRSFSIQIPDREEKFNRNKPEEYKRSKTVSDNTEKKKSFPNRLTRSDKQGIRDSYDYYDIILSHLLDEGYAETPEAAEAIMVNMSEEWRESIVENVSSGRAKVRNVKQRVSSAEIISNTQKQDKIAQHFADHAAKKKAAGDEAHAAATKSGKSPSDAETARQRAHRAYEKQLKRG